MESKESPILQGLNPAQRDAVVNYDSPSLIIAGAGSGKTRVLTSRIAYMIEQGIKPWNILALTFTNKAAESMRERIAQMLPDNRSRYIRMGTFHSVFSRILRENAEKIGFTDSFTIYEPSDCKNLLKTIVRELNLPDEKYKPNVLSSRISYAKNCLVTPGAYLANSTCAAEDRQAQIPEFGNIYNIYCQRCKRNGAMDFDDLLLQTNILLRDCPDVLARYQEQFQYILVDEYQDTNVTQYLFLRLICQKYRNLCCVGDDDQSIYSWRGAEIENILRFEKDFPDAKVIRLERNYRSTANILTAASALIRHNRDRLGKTLKVAENSPAARGDNSKIKVVSTYSGSEEAAYVADEIENLHRNGTGYSQMAVLVRTAAQTREFEEKFIAEAIPYQVIGGPKFYERAEIRDALAYLRVILQPADDLALERIINKPARGIGAKTIEKFENEARVNHISMFMAIEKMLKEGALSGKVKTNVSELINNFYQWRQTMNAVSPDDLAAQVLEDSGYMEMLKMDKSAEAEGRIENLKELINVMSDTEQYPTLSDFMEHVSLVMDNDNNIDTDKVMLITLHSAKGLEFDAVFLPGWEEGLFPHQRALDEGGGSALEEERRLAYVAMTRAKQKLYILTALNRRIYGQWQNNLPSRFINELPPANIEICNMAATYFGAAGNYGGSWAEQHRSSSNWYNRSRQTEENVIRDSDRFSYVRDEDDGWSGSVWRAKQKARNAASATPVGSRVFHETFGYGKVLKIEGNKLEIWFDQAGHKKLLKDYVRKA